MLDRLSPPQPRMPPMFTSLYIHVPFCARKCGYCAFYSIAGAGADLRRAYLRRLSFEFAAGARECGPLESVFVGGGTPTLLARSELSDMLGAVHGTFALAPGCEITVESNPDTLTQDKIDVLARRGVNRVSLGVQTFFETHRRTLGRSGSLDGLGAAVSALRAASVRNLGLDLIYAIPGQTLGEWEDDLRRAAEHGVEHVSTYELTMEEGSRLAAEGVTPVVPGLAADMWEAAETVLEPFGFRLYEVSNLARPGRECLHNLSIWRGAKYLGCGPAASSYDGVDRWQNVADLEAWLAEAAPEVDHLPAENRAAEILAFGLRTVDGWTPEVFRTATGVGYGELRGEAIDGLVADGLLELTPSRLHPTRRGLLFADTVAERLL